MDSAFLEDVFLVLLSRMLTLESVVLVCRIYACILIVTHDDSSVNKRFIVLAAGIFCFDARFDDRFDVCFYTMYVLFMN